MTAGAPPLACAALEIALNRYLGLEPGVLADLARLEGRVIALQLEGPGWAFFLRPHRAGVQVLDRWDGAPGVWIRARPSQLLRQALRGSAGGGPLSGVQVEGDAGLMQQFATLLERVGFDLEEWLGQWLDAGAARRAGGALRALAGWGRQTAATLSLDTAEYLREETRDLVHRDEVEQWSVDVDGLRDRAEGLAARLTRIERRLGGGHP